VWEQVVSDLDLKVTKRTTFSDQPTTLAGDVEGHRVEVIRSEGGEEWTGSRIVVRFKEPLGPNGLTFRRRSRAKRWRLRTLDWLEDRELLPNDRWMATVDWGGDTTLVLRARKSAELRRWLTQERRIALRELGPSLLRVDRKHLVSRCAGDAISVGRIIEIIALVKALE